MQNSRLSPDKEVLTFNRRYDVTKRSLLFFLCAEAFIVIVLLFLAIIIQNDNSRNFVDYFVFGAILLNAVVALYAIFQLVTRHLLLSTPALIVNRQGVQVGKLPWTFGNVFISWEDIGTIYIYRQLNKSFLCICPRDTQKYLSRFSIWKRLALRYNLPSGAPINVQQEWIEQPIHAVLQQLLTHFKDQIDLHEVRLNTHSMEVLRKRKIGV